MHKVDDAKPLLDINFFIDNTKDSDSEEDVGHV